MKIFKSEFALWWFVFAVIIFTKYLLLGNPSDSIFDTHTYKDYGVIFKTVSVTIWATVLGSLLNWIYKLIFNNYNPKVHLCIIGVLVIIQIFTL
tara:strand:- start:94 stop:375 length:282 start_codon:yes stop_codon:yes gene_type:complete